ncbi:MAG: phosphoribosyltransferase family protein [Patescibacteria group bacterium]
MKASRKTKKKEKRPRANTVYLHKKQPMIRISGGKYVALIKELIRIIQGSYKPDLIIGIATGGLFAAIIARVLNVPYGIWMAQGYKDRSRGVGKRSRIVRFADEISFIDPRNKKKLKLKKGKLPFNKVLLIDDLDETYRTFKRGQRLLREWYGEGFEIRTACLIHKTCSQGFVNYFAQTMRQYKTTGKWPWIIWPHEDLIDNLKAFFKIDHIK